jgi:hypothetical protein
MREDVESFVRVGFFLVWHFAKQLAATWLLQYTLELSFLCHPPFGLLWLCLVVLPYVFGRANLRRENRQR